MSWLMNAGLPPCQMHSLTKMNRGEWWAEEVRDGREERKRRRKGKRPFSNVDGFDRASPGRDSEQWMKCIMERYINLWDGADGREREGGCWWGEGIKKKRESHFSIICLVWSPGLFSQVSFCTILLVHFTLVQTTFASFVVILSIHAFITMFFSYIFRNCLLA